jgi:hypothetical protein
MVEVWTRNTCIYFFYALNSIQIQSCLFWQGGASPQPFPRHQILAPASFGGNGDDPAACRSIFGAREEQGVARAGHQEGSTGGGGWARKKRRAVPFGKEEFLLLRFGLLIQIERLALRRSAKVRNSKYPHASGLVCLRPVAEDRWKLSYGRPYTTVSLSYGRPYTTVSLQYATILLQYRFGSGSGMVPAIAGHTRPSTTV